MGDDFAERLLEALDLGCIPTPLIQVEITEQALFEEGAGHVARAVKALSQRGIRICLDDFGTGYSSLTHLRDLPADVLKIDRSFVARLDEGDESAAIVQALIDLAAKLGLNLVAEGIETLAQLRWLKERGCPTGQGFLISKPLLGDDVCHLLRKGSLLELSR
ncbi:MAG: hypothetical protein JWP15_3162, partial [Alphaproteobacteria bacterium]|nr:hypothetical protein [Alphaproteobacteria bacterium]